MSMSISEIRLLERRAAHAEAQLREAELRLAEMPIALAVIKTWRENAERLEAQLAKAERCIDKARRVMGGEGVDDQGEAWDKCLRILDAYGLADSAPAVCPCPDFAVMGRSDGRGFCGMCGKERVPADSAPGEKP